ncbi:uncharacterized protein [Amphiura filiformis]|uniref:uncharacterized protein n=1 Tax=Amphiura filiformis TaxID=82378 RepID=UPI003B223468
MAENGENATAVPPNSETNTVVETTEIMESLPVSEISQGNENNTMDIVSMALSNVTETADLMVVDCDSNAMNVVTEEEVQQFEQVEVVEQQVVQEIPIGSEGMVITTSEGQIILPANSTPAELSAVETLVGGALQQTVLSQPVIHQHLEHDQIEQSTETQTVQVEGSTVVSAVPMTLTTSSVPVVEASNQGIVHFGGGTQDISASSLLGSIATMIDSTESSIHASAAPSLTLAGMNINTTTNAPTVSNIVTRTVPANNVNFVNASVEVAATPMTATPVAITNNAISVANVNDSVVTTGATSIGLNSILTGPTQSSSLPSTITIKTPPGSNSVSQSLLNSILNNSDVQSLLKRNPGQPITIVRVPEDSPGGKNVNKITVTTGAPAAKKPVFQPSQAAKTYMRITTPANKPSPTTVKFQPTAPNNSNPKRRPGRPPKVREPPPEPVVVKSKKTRSGRVSRPPIHRVRDYKTIHIQEMGEPDYEKDDFTDYDGELLKNTPPEFSTYGGRPRAFKCDKCDKAYIGKAGLARHFKNNPDHGDPAELGVTYDEEEESTQTSPLSEQVTPVHTVQTPSFRKKRRGRPPAPRPPNGDPDFIPNKRTPSKTTTAGNLGTQALYRRKQRIQELIKTIGDEDLMELALPRLSKAITVWEFLLMKVEEAHSQKLPFQEILQHFESVRKHVRLFADECLERVSAKSDKQGDASVESDNNTQENQSTERNNSEPSNSDEVQTDNDKCDDKQQKLTQDNTQETQTADEQNKKEGVLPPSEDGISSEIKRTSSDASAVDTTPSTSESKLRTTENGEISETVSDSQQSSDSKVEESTCATDKDTNDVSNVEENDKQTDKSSEITRSESPPADVKDTAQKPSENSSSESLSADAKDTAQKASENSSSESPPADAKDTTQKASENSSSESPPADAKDTTQKASENSSSESPPADVKDITQKASENSSSESPPADAKDTAAMSDKEICQDLLELDEEMAKALGMEAGKYSVREWTATNKLPAFYRFSKNVTGDDSLSEEEINEEDDGPSAKRQRVDDDDEASATTQADSSSTAPRIAKQVTQIQLPREDAIKPTPPLAPAPQMVVQQQTSSHYYKPATVPISLKSVSPGGNGDATSTAAKQQQQQVVTSPQPVQQEVEQEPQPMEVTEEVNEVTESEQTVEETEEVTYQTDEQGHSIVPEGSTIMQMEDGTFLVQKPDGTAMQIHCPDGMTIETIQALLSMDAGNILQAAE